ncbi:MULTISPECIES: hypothetical protein [unclassified Pseudoalteromonas]|uniref:hypothetical protein n=1 Tax=unclassified Pseudoalteromonas TaxID=194690 RepID=UPI002096D753|nr:hypothetical protein [Pseudoalteromonas sp. XMcav2-N]MCO7188740.1 hypothetical protein [Pseudoalteromonas sp. XMcav2-N]
MKKNTSYCFSWASSCFKYEELLEKASCEMVKYDVSHHSSWFSKQRSYRKELIHLFKCLLVPAIQVVLHKPVILFGTNLCRIFFFAGLANRRLVFVYNELPRLDNSIVGKLDRFIFKRFSKRILVSSIERSKLLEGYYDVSGLLVLPNIPSFLEESEIEVKRPELVYAGLISANRFPEEYISKINKSGLNFNLLGHVAHDFDLSVFENHHYYGVLEQRKSQDTQKNFQYALLSYTTSEVNNNYCAPIKLYEYIAAGCVCVCVNENEGLKRFLESYPALFVMIDKVDIFNFNAEEYESQRRVFFEEEHLYLENTITNVTSLFGFENAC